MKIIWYNLDKKMSQFLEQKRSLIKRKNTEGYVVSVSNALLKLTVMMFIYRWSVNNKSNLW